MAGCSLANRIITPWETVGAVIFGFYYNASPSPQTLIIHPPVSWLSLIGINTDNLTTCVTDRTCSTVRMTVSCACFLKFTLVLHVLIRNLTGLSYRSTFLTFLAIRPRECQATLWKSVIGRRGESRSVAKTHEPRTRPESFNSQHSRDAERKAKFILRALFTQGVCSLESFGRWTMWLNARNCNISFFSF